MKHQIHYVCRAHARIHTAVALFAFLAIFQGRANAQVGSDAFSPSITSFHGSDGNTWVVTAYTIPASGSTGRTIGLQRKKTTDGAYTTISSPFSSGVPQISGTSVDNMDEANILAVGTDTLVLVVRAWKADGSGDQYGDRGSAWADLNNTIFTNCGIFLAVSTDRGSHWGYWDAQNSSTLDGGKWKQIAVSDINSLTSTDANTVEYPRIAYRKGFDSHGYIVWNTKSWVNESSVTYTNADGSSPSYNTAPFLQSDGTGTSGWWVTNCSVSVAAFNVNESGTQEGWVFLNGSSAVLSSTFSNVSGGLAHNHFSPGPESPSVAISPDHQIWISYQKICYAGYDAFTSGVWYFDPDTPDAMSWMMNGQEQPDAFLYVTAGTFSPSSGFSFQTPQELYHDEIVGYYNHSRGYFYYQDYSSWAPNSETSNSNWDGTLAEGPSVQVACNHPNGTCSNYSVGVIDAFTTGGTTSAGTNIADPRSWLLFFHADLSSGGTAQSFVTTARNNVGTIPDFGENLCQGGCTSDAASRVEPDGRSSDGSLGPVYFRFFPTLKYASAPDGFAAYTANPSIDPSFFILTWMSAYQDNSAHGSNYLDSVSCRVAVSFDNESFEISTANTPSIVRQIQDPDDATPTYVFATHWGSKIDVCGDGDDFRVHVIWHTPEGNNAKGVLEASSGSCILVRPYLTNYLPTDAHGFPGPSTWFANVNSVTTPVYNPLVAFTMGSDPSLSGIEYANVLTMGSASATFAPGTNAPTSISTPGIYNALYVGTPNVPDIGDLGFSDQRKIAMTGTVAHAVAYGTGTNFTGVEYSTQMTIGNHTTDWTAPLEIDIEPNTYVEPPCIASYVRDPSVSQSAIAVCWGFEDDIIPPNGTGIKVRVKESGNCNWSQEFAIPTSSCACAPSITPLTVPVSSGSKNTYLLGWVITWEDYLSDVLNSVTLLRGGQATNQLTQNQNWGDYSNYTTTGTQIILTALTPSGSHEHLGATSNQSNGITADHSNEIVYTSDGDISGCKALNAQYFTSGATLGNWSGNTAGSQQVLSAYNIKGQFDRDPSVTVTSFGQNIAAWEHIGPGLLIPDWPSPGIFTPGFTSSIRIAKTTDAGGDWSVLQDFITLPYAGDPTFHWLTKPSVTAFPTTTISGSANAHGAELLYTQEDGYCYCSPAPGFSPFPHVNTLHERLYDLSYQGSWGSGTWTSGEKSPFPTSGVNSQRSFGLYTTGPQYALLHGSYQLVDQDLTTSYTHGLTYALGNALSSGAVTDKFTTPVIGAFKGTFAQPLGEDLFRVEDRYMDSSAIEFQWGGVYVDDTAIGMAAREVILHNPASDSGFASHEAIRDSIFQTEWFDWPVSGEVVYSRWLAFAVGRFTDTTIDTNKSDGGGGGGDNSSKCTGSGSAQGTTTKLYVPDTTVRGDSSFIKPCVQIKYTVELVHQSGQIDTIDRMTYNPFGQQLIAPKKVHLVNANYAGDTVMLRVRADIPPCVPDADSNVVFGREQMLDTLRGLADTTIAIGPSGGVMPPPDTCFMALGPFANPSAASSNDVSILVHLCGIGAPITVQVYDMIGNPVGGQSHAVSDGQVWDRIPITSPPVAGSYYVQISAPFYGTSLGLTVY